MLFYLDKRHFLSKMKNECELFKEQNEKTMSKFPPLRYKLEVDVMDLFDTFPDLGIILVSEPMKWQRVCNDVFFATLISTNEDIEDVGSSQCAVLVRPKSVPGVLIKANRKHHNGLDTYEGVLLSISKPTSYVFHTVWSCPEECEGNEVIFQYIPKSPPKCYVCRSVLFENSGLRRCGEQVTATFILGKNLNGKEFKIVDDLIPSLKLGSKYYVHTVVFQKAVFVWSLEEIVPLSAPITAPVPKDVQELFEACASVPWKFIYCLASVIGVDFCPLNCFMHLKIILLMSLVSVKANLINDSDIIHVLAAGYDTMFVGEIMTAASKLGSASNFLGTNSSVSWSLIASTGGVCVMPLPLHVYNQKQTHSVLATIETGEVTTDTGKTKLRSAIWAQGMDFKKIVLYNVASVFGTVARGDFCEYTDEIVDFMLQRSMEPTERTPEDIQALKDVAKYIDIVAGIEVKLDSSTQKFLRNYFIAARKERAKASVSVGSMKALIATCMASARLCRRPVANIDDAVLAVWLHASGCQEPRFAPDEYLQAPADIKKLQKMMNKFKEWLEQFTGSVL